MNRRKNLPRKKVLVMYFEQNQSFAKIAKHFKCSTQTVCNRFVEWGVDARDLSTAISLREHTWGNKIAESLTGHTLPDATRKRISKATKGRTAHNKGLHKPSPKTQGELHWNWKGGISREHVRIRASAAYKEWRSAVFARDDYTCQLCGERGRKIEADHIKPFATHVKLRFKVSNGRTLCKDCHKGVTREQRK